MNVNDKDLKIRGEDTALDQTLRPSSFNEYIGQEKVKKNLRILIEAAKKRKESVEHILIHGPSGLGKTTLSYLIAENLGANIRVTSGSALAKAGDIGALLTNLSDGDVLFIDEVHRLNKQIEEVLYPAMDNFKLDIVIGKGNSAKTLQIDLPKFTIIAATTRVSLLSAPFRARFGVHYKLDFYLQNDIEKILERSAIILNVNIAPTGLKKLAAASRFTPRIANRLLKRVRDLAQVEGHQKVNDAVVSKTLDLLEIDSIGLDGMDKKILIAIAERFKGGPAGLKAISSFVGEEANTIEEVYEPYLLQIGFLVRTPKGRVVTDKCLAYFNKNHGLLI